MALSCAQDVCDFVPLLQNPSLIVMVLHTTFCLPSYDISPSACEWTLQYHFLYMLTVWGYLSTVSMYVVVYIFQIIC
jgi:hypothetical protein